MQEREGREAGLSLTYRLIDLDRLAMTVADLPEVLAWARRLGFDGLNVTHPFKQAVVPLLHGLSEDARDLGAVNTVVIRGGEMVGRNTDWSGYTRAFQQVLPEAVHDRAVLVGAGGAGVAVGYGLLRQGAEHVAILDHDLDRAKACVERLANRFGDSRVSITEDLEDALADAQGVVNATPIGMYGYPGSSVPRQPAATGPVGQRRRLLPAGDRARRRRQGARLSGARRRRHGRPAGGRRLRVLHGSARGLGADGAPLRGADRLMRTGIATVSLSGVLEDKLAAAAGAGFDTVELFDNDLISSPMSPREVARRCADLGLEIALFQPVRDVEGVAPDAFEAVLHRLRTKLGVMADLGTTTLLACSNAQPGALDDLDLTAEQLHRVGEVAAEAGVTVAYEALAWGTHVNRVGRAWEAVQRADHPAVTLAVDTFHILARGDDGTALADVPGDRIGFLQVADAPLLDMNLLEWSRHHRCFPGQGTLDVTGVVAATLAAGYRGPLSLEVFSDVVRETDPHVTARDAMRSLVFLEDDVAGVVPDLEPGVVTPAAPRATRTDAAFLEIASPPGQARGGRDPRPAWASAWPGSTAPSP